MNLAMFSGRWTPPFLKGERFNITQRDLAEAKLLTPSLDLSRFNLGKPWPLAPHQLRRSMMIHARASGLVSVSALTWQAKHRTEQMTAYYIEFYQRWEELLAAGDKRAELLDGSIAAKMAESYVASISAAIEHVKVSNQFISPYGKAHKRMLMDQHPVLTLASLKKLEKAGHIKQTLLGVCGYQGDCQYFPSGSPTGCLSKNNKGQPCPFLILDVKKLSKIEEVIEDAKDQLFVLPPGASFSLRRKSLEETIKFGEIAKEMIHANKATNDQ